MMLHFIRPMWLWLYIPIAVYLIWIIYSKRHQNPWLNVCDPHLLPTLVENGRGKTQYVFYLLLTFIYALSIFALAGPAWDKIKRPVYQSMSSMMVVLDLSPAMQMSDIMPNRLVRAKFKIRDLIKAAQNTQFGMVVFTQEAFAVTPLSRDGNTLNALMDEVNPSIMPLSGSNIAEGLNLGLSLLQQINISQGSVLLVTASAPNEDAWSAAKAIAESGNYLQILAMLPDNKANEAVISELRELADAGKGSFTLFSTNDINQILADNRRQEAIQEESTNNAYFWQDAGPWFCLLLIPLALLVLREKSYYENR